VDAAKTILRWPEARRQHDIVVAEGNGAGALALAYCGSGQKLFRNHLQGRCPRLAKVRAELGGLARRLKSLAGEQVQYMLRLAFSPAASRAICSQ